MTLREKRLLVVLGLTLVGAIAFEALRPRCSCVLGEYKLYTYREAGVDDPADCAVHGPLFQY